MRRNFAIRAIVAGAGLLALSGATLAQTQAYTNAPIDVYAGPAPDYPIVAVVPEGTALTVLGCVDDYSWCDVAAPGLRGWAYSEYLSYPYQGVEVPIINYGPTIGLPIVVFAIGPYWGHHYRDRPWYRDEPFWANHEPPQHGVRPPEHRPNMVRPPGTQPEHEIPAHGRGPEPPPVRSGPREHQPQPQPPQPQPQPLAQPRPQPQPQPQPLAQPRPQPQPLAQPRPQPQPPIQQPQFQRGVQPGMVPGHATGGPPPMPPHPAMPAPRGGFGGGPPPGGRVEREPGQSNH